MNQDDVHEPAAEVAKPKAKKRRKTIRVRADIAHGGSLHVRHMADVLLEGVAVALADGDGKDRVWIQLAKTGAFKGHAAGPFELDAKVFGDIVRNFRATANRAIPIDFEHASEADPTQGSIPTDGAPAQGWILDLKIDGGNLWGLVEWGDKAREYIRAGSYKFFSPAIRFGARDRVTGAQVGARMTSGALTNNPFLDGLAPLAAKDVDDAETAIERLRAMVATEPTRTLADALAECDAGTESMGDVDEDELDAAELSAKETAMADEKNVTIALSEAQTKVAELSLKLKDEAARADTAEASLKTLTEWKEARELKDVEERVSLAFDTYKDARKLTDADKEAMTIVLKAKPETFEKQYPKIAPALSHLQRNLTDRREEELPKESADVDTKLGEETFSQTVSRLMSEKKVSYTAAVNQAVKLRA
jgi:phage I-like protein